MENGRIQRSDLIRPLCTATLTILLLTGCQSTRTYQASSLPAELIAPRLGSVRDVDFSQLARSLGNSNVLHPGDLVSIEIATGLEAEKPPQWRGRISDDGAVSVPLVGNVQVAGLETRQAELAIRQAAIQRGKFVDPAVSLVVEKPRSNRITVIGAVTQPGTYELPIAGSDVLAAIVAARGLSDQAGTVIEIRHPPYPTANGAVTGLASFPQQPLAGQPRTVRIDLEQTSSGYGEDYHLEDGSAVMVMPRPKRYFHVIGLVNKADQFEMRDGTEVRLLDAIAMAGNRKLELADKVHVIRQLPDQAEPVVIEVSVREAKRDASSNLRLAPGDVVSVEETPVTFVVSTIREFIRFGFSSSLPLF